jgi:hypothetical protein
MRQAGGRATGTSAPARAGCHLQLKDVLASLPAGKALPIQQQDGIILMYGQLRMVTSYGSYQ